MGKTVADTKETKKEMEVVDARKKKSSKSLSRSTTKKLSLQVSNIFSIVGMF